MKKLNTLEDFLAEARRLRNAADFCEREFLDFLRRFEARRDLWQSKAKTFDDLLSSSDICKPNRYRNWVRANDDQVIAPSISKIGVHGAVEACRIVNRQKRADAVEEMVRSVTLKGTVMSRQSAAQIVARYEPKPSTLPDANEKIAKLEEENERLRARVSKLTTEVADLRARLRAVQRSSNRRGRSHTEKSSPETS